MPDQPIPLFRVLIEEYNNQQTDHYPSTDAAFKAYDDLPEEDEDGRKRVNSEQLKKFYEWLHLESKTKRPALCFSGGGIRSATFGLGVEQGLGRQGLLGPLDF